MDLLEKPQKERQKLLAEHNLFVSFGELRLIKQAILEGRLWEHLEMKAHGHPALFQALKKFKKYEDYLEENGPVTKRRGLFYFDSVGLSRPEVVRHRKRLAARYLSPEKADTLFLLPQTSMKPFHNAREWQNIHPKIHESLGERSSEVHVCVYSAPFGVVPLELDEVYPLSQHEVAVPLDNETVDYVAGQVAAYIETMSYEKVVLLEDRKIWRTIVTSACRRVCKKKNIRFLKLQRQGTKDAFVTRVREALRE
jgi:7-cyano-7-deazaguanine tRNA-ribosyltransferase